MGEAVEILWQMMITKKFLCLFTEMEDRLWNIPPFECEGVPLSQLRQKWLEYKQSFMYVAQAVGKKYSKQKWKNIFLAIAGRQLQRIFESLPGADVEDPGGDEDEDAVDPFDTMIAKLDQYFAPKRHETFERHVFWSMTPNTDETLDKFLLRAQVQANKCYFGSSENKSREVAVIDKVVSLASHDLKKRILERADIDLDGLTQMVNTHLSIQDQARELNMSSLRVNSFNSTGRDQSVVSKVNEWNRVTRCNKCGYSNHKTGDANCPAKTRRCNNCQVVGHFSKMCSVKGEKRSFGMSSTQTQSKGRQRKKHRVNAISEMENDSEPEDTEVNENFVFAISNNDDEQIWCRVGGVSLEMMLDSGSKYNVIDEKAWNYLKENKAQLENTRPSNKVLKAYAQESALEIVCMFEAALSIEDVDQTYTTRADFYVVKRGQQALLGRVSAKRLQLYRVGLPSTWKKDTEIGRINEKQLTKFPKMKGKRV